jgi:phosphopantothenoylcysteine decarboxylase/phosphopantothenate--cysteine ligase
MTKAATELIHPYLMEWATGNETILELTGKVEHIQIAGAKENFKGKADMILVCPSTANTINKIAAGIDDNPVTTIVTTAFGSKTPIIIVPAMHDSMFRHPILIENIEKLKKYGMEFINPRMVENKAKIAEPQEIINRILDILSDKKDLVGKNFIVTAGGAREYIDHIRFISNPATGKMGIAITEEILARGGKCTLVLGPGSITPPISANTINVETANDYLTVIKNEIEKEKYDVLISAAAISDFTPKIKKEEKVSSDTPELTIQLIPTPKIIDEIRKMDQKIFIAAFKAESTYEGDKLIEKAKARMNKGGIDLIVANNVSKEKQGAGFGSNTNDVYIIENNDKVTHIAMKEKRYIASELLDIISKKIN